MSKELDTTEAVAYGVMGMLFIPVLATLSYFIVFLYALVQVRLWDWFAVPYFHQQHIGVWPMAGIGVLVSTFFPYIYTPKEKDDKWWSPFLRPLVALTIGYLIHRFLV